MCRDSVYRRQWVGGLLVLLAGCSTLDRASNAESPTPSATPSPTPSLLGDFSPAGYVATYYVPESYDSVDGPYNHVKVWNASDHDRTVAMTIVDEDSEVELDERITLPADNAFGVYLLESGTNYSFSLDVLDSTLHETWEVEVPDDEGPGDVCTTNVKVVETRFRKGTICET